MESPQRVNAPRATLGGGDLFITKGIQAELGNTTNGDAVGGRKAKGKAKHWFKSRVQTTKSAGAPRCSVLSWEAGEVSA